MLKELIAFEWRYHTRQITFAAAVLLFLLMGFTLPATSYGAENLAINSPFLVMQSLAFVSLLSVFAAAVFGANAVLRDPEHRMQEIVHCTPVGRLRFLTARFAGAFLATLTAVAFSMLAMVVAIWMPWLDLARVAPFDAARYLWAFAAITVPNVLFASALLFAIAVLTRNALATYAGAVFIYILYFIAAALTNSPLMAQSRPGAMPGPSAAVFDPFGLTAFFEVTRYWAPAAKNARLVPLEGVLLYNRVLWIALSIAIAAFVLRRFSFRLRGKTAAPKPVASTLPAPTPRHILPTISPSSLAAFRSALRIELRVLRSKPVLLLLFLWLCLAATEINSDLQSAEYGAQLIPATTLIIAAIRAPISIIGTILLIYYGAEMFWREQRHRMAAILDATPVASAVMIAAKWTAMAVLVALVIATGILPGIALQLARGYTDFEPLVYLSLFWFVGLPLLLFAAAALLIHALSPGKYAGMMLVLLLAVFTRIAPRLGLDHPLWQFANAPSVRHSDMNGFGHDPVAFHWLVLHWSALALLFAMLAAFAWRRIAFPVKDRLRAVKRGQVVALAAIAVVTGGWASSTLPRTSEDELNAWKADYERTYKRLASTPQPRIASIIAKVDLVPEERRYRVAGDYELVNETGAPMRSVLVSVRREARNASVSMPGARASSDERSGMIRFDLAQPLAPGARTKLHFDLGFESDDDTIANNGSFLMSFRCFPGLGYRASYELNDPRERRKRGLAPLKASPPVEGPEDAGFGLERVAFDLTISTAPDQIAVAPGHLERAWTENGRRHFRYQSDAPIFNRFAIASARYEVEKRKHRGIDVELYYHAAHRANAQRVLDAAVAALDYCETNFGRYPSRQLRLAEVPSYWPFGAFAMPETVFLVESRTLLIDGSDPARIDLLTRRVAHEVAHQWWGHILAPADGPGASVLVETLTRYTDMILIERLRGAEQARGMRALELDRYLAGRSNDPDGEPPLYRAGSQSYLYYSKGALALYAIRDRIGEARLNLALRNLLSEFRDRGGRATSIDLIRHLHRTAGEEHAAFIDEWMKEIILYDFRVTSAKGTERGVIVHIDATKTRADAQGNETPIAFREPIEIGVDDAVQKYVLHEGRNVITIATARRPAYVSVDPNFLRLDTKRADNERGID